MKKIKVSLIMLIMVSLIFFSCSKDSTGPDGSGGGDFEWCTVPAGEYTYGWGDTIKTIDYDYQIMKYEVNNQQYVDYLEEAYAAGDITVTSSTVEGYYPGDLNYSAGNYVLYSLGTPLNCNCARISFESGEFIINVPTGYFSGDFDNHPVVYVTWFGSWVFAEHYGFSLPTEHEWEKAARGMTGADYPWGENYGDDISDNANYGNSGDPWDNGTTPVGMYNGQTVQGFQTTDSSSPYGVYDMAGNVWEWTDSFWSETFFPRVQRGGGWPRDATELQSWCRGGSSPTIISDCHGFRCVRY